MVGSLRQLWSILGKGSWEGYKVEKFNIWKRNKLASMVTEEQQPGDHWKIWTYMEVYSTLFKVWGCTRDQACPKFMRHYVPASCILITINHSKPKTLAWLRLINWHPWSTTYATTNVLSYWRSWSNHTYLALVFISSSVAIHVPKYCVKCNWVLTWNVRNINIFSKSFRNGGIKSNVGEWHEFMQWFNFSLYLLV
jgi:hypothetical protein